MDFAAPTPSVSTVPLAQPIDTLVRRADGVLVATWFDRANATYRIGTVGNDGVLAPIGTPRADCCVVVPGLGYRDGAEWVALARDRPAFDTGGRLGFIAFDLTTGASRAFGELAANLVVNALVQAAPAPPRPDGLFRDSFETLALSSESAAAARDAKSIAEVAGGRATGATDAAAGATTGAIDEVAATGSTSIDTDPASSRAQAAKGLAPAPIPATPRYALVLLALVIGASVLRRNTRRG